MTNEQIKKALGCCKNQCCSYCPHWCEMGCQYQTLSDALELITEQEKEIEQLKAENKQAKIDVLTELKRQAEHCDQWNCEVVPIEYTDEMIEELKK